MGPFHYIGMTEYIKMVSNLFNDVVHVTIYSKKQIILLDSTINITSKIIYVKIYTYSTPKNNEFPSNKNITL